METSGTTILPVVGESSDSLLELISRGQPVLLVRDGQPVAVVLDVDSYEEAEVAVTAPA
jgi:PHD/YefM family antitoxin component YafN of YafNO toxin-antitoxin module